MIVKCLNLEEMMEVVTAAVRAGLLFEASTTNYTVTFTGGY